MGRKDKIVSSENDDVGAKMRLARQEKGLTLTEMAERLGYTKSHLSAVENGIGRPSQELVDKYEQALGLEEGELMRLKRGTQLIAGKGTGSIKPTDNQEVPIRSRRIDLREAPTIGNFYGREKELAEIKQWIEEDGCQLVLVSGIGGIGKTSLVGRLIEEIRTKEPDRFDYICWYSLQNAPAIEDILGNVIRLVSDQKPTELPGDIDRKIALLINYLRDPRCLLVLDNVEAVLKSGDVEGQYREGYEGFGRLFRAIGETNHNSCLLLTSREKPGEFTLLEAKTSAVRSLQLEGLKQDEGLKIFQEKDLSGILEDQANLIHLYAGNPLALKLIAEYIRRLFGGNIAEFLKGGEAVFGDIYQLLDKQFRRLSALEQEIMYWLAIERELISIEDLLNDMGRTRSKGDVLEALNSLDHRSMIDTRDGGYFTLQPAISEYVIDDFIANVFEEISQEKLKLFKSHTLMKAQAQDYVRHSQDHFILTPLADRLLSALGKEGVEQKFLRLLSTLRKDPDEQQGYAAGNILNLLVALEADLRHYDFSDLTVKQAYLQEANLPEVNFTHANLETSVFTDTFGSILSVAFSPDGKYLAAGTANSDVRLWDASSGTPVLTCLGHKGWVWSVAFSPDGMTLASGSADETVRIWDIKTGQCINTLRKHKGWVRSVAFSPDGKLLASGSEDRTICFWDVKTGNYLSTLEGHENWIRAIAFSPDGTMLASGSEDQTVRLWDVNSGSLIYRLRRHKGRVRSVAFSPDGRVLATGGEDPEVWLWDVSDGLPIKSIEENTERVLSLAFSPLGNMLAIGTGAKIVRLWDINTDQLHDTLYGHRDWIRSVAFNPDGMTLASGGEDQTVRLWNVSSGKCLKTLQGYSNWVWSVAYSPGGETFASGGEDRTVRIWDSEHKTDSRILRGHSSRVWSVAYSPDGKLLASGSEDQTICLWDVSTGLSLKPLLGHTHRVRAVAFSPDNNTLASGSEDQTVRLWDVRTRQCIRILAGHTHLIWAVAFSPKGDVVASGSGDKTVRLWDVETGHWLKTLQEHADSVWSVAFSPDGKLLASGGADQTIRLWEVGAGTCLKVLRGHTRRVCSVAFSPDGHILASGSHDQSIRIWDVESGDCINILCGHNNRVWSVAFSPDGKELISCSEDGTIRIWDAESGKALDTLTTAPPYKGMDIPNVRGLTPAQKATLIMLGAVER